MTETSIKVFFSYSHKDQALRDSLATHLSNLEWQKVITSWHAGEIIPGTPWNSKIKTQLDSADIILLLISPDFIASSYCREVEITQAMRRHETGEAHIIPVILRASDWTNTPFGKLQAYPQNAKPVTSWVNQDEAFLSVTQGIRTVAQLILDYRIQQAQQQQKETAKATYLQNVEEVLSDGSMTIAKRDILDDRRDELGLSPQEAKQIEADLYERCKKYEDNLNKYKQTLNKYIETSCYPFDEKIQKDLELRQRYLGLKSEDVERIENPILEEVKAKYQEKLRAERIKKRLRQKQLERGKSKVRKVWKLIKKWIYFLLVIPAGIGFLFFISQCSSSPKLLLSDNSPTPSPETTVVSTPPAEPLTSDDIENLQQQISVGERVLATSEKKGAKYPDVFQAAKEKGANAIASGNYQAAINVLTLTRQSSAREFYKNAPETLINLNNAYTGDKLAYTIAVAAPLSLWDNYGLGVLRGVALAQQKINEKGGIEDANGNKMPLKVVLVDDQNTSNAVKLARFLSGLSLNVSNRNKDLKILGLIGHQTSDLTLKLGKIYQEAKLPVISPSATSTELFGKFSYVHLVAPSTRQMAKSLNKKIDKPRVIVFYDSEEEFSRSFGTEVCKAFVTCKPRNFHETPVVNTERVKREIADDSTAIVIAFNVNKSEDNKKRASEIIKAVSEFNANSQNKMELFAANAFSDQSLINKASAENVSIVRVSPWELNLSGNLSFDLIKKNNQFLADNRKLWNTGQVNWFTLMAYNATTALVEAIKESKSPPPNNDDELKAMREKINAVFISGAFSVPGALGEIHFGKEGYVERGNVICLSRVGANTNNLTDCQLSEESFPIK